MRLTGATRVAAVIGHPVRHSLSPVIFDAAFEAAALDWAYVAFEVAPGDAGNAIAAMRTLGLAGLSVTMPHKSAVAAAVDRLSDDALALGAVNCVAVEAGELIGHNTDGVGFLDALRAQLDVDVAGRRVAIVGAGGAARAVVRAVAGAGAVDVAVINRTARRAEAAAGLAGNAGRVGAQADVTRADVVVNATSVGMAGDVALPVSADLLRDGQIVVDLIYHPAETPLLAAARAVGAVTANGLAMLVHQAGHQFERWTGQAPPLDAIWDAVQQIH